MIKTITGMIDKIFKRNKSIEDTFNSMRINAVVDQLVKRGCISREEYENCLKSQIESYGR